MPLELINPDGLPTPESYTHVVSATGSRVVFIAGQVSENAAGDLVGPDDLPTQAHQAFANLARALTAAGARPNQVAKLTIYVVDHHPDYLPAISAARESVFGPHKPADTLLGIQTLAQPGFLIEIDAFAVID